MTNGQPSGTQEAVTVDSTDSAATENLDSNTVENPTELTSAAIAAESAAAEAWVTSYFGSSVAAAQDNSVLLDVAQLLAVGGINYSKVVYDSVVYTQSKGIQAGQVYEMYTQEQVLYSETVAQRMQRLLLGDTVDSSFEYRKPYLKQRQLVKVVSDLQPDPDGKMAYQVYLGNIDPIKPLDTPTWRTTDRAGGQSGAIYLYPAQASDGSTVYLRYRGSELERAALGHTELMDKMVRAVMNSEKYKQFMQVVASEPRLQRNSIRRSHRGQLVFWQAQRVSLDRESELTAPATN